MDPHLINDAAKIKAQRIVIGQNCANTNTLLTNYMNQQANVVIYGRFVSGHIIINCERKVTDQHYLMTILLITHDMMKGCFADHFGCLEVYSSDYQC